MSNNSLSLIDPNFKNDASSNCHLLLKITNNSFSYAVVDEKTGKINLIFDKQHCENIEDELKMAFKNDLYLSKPYSAVKVSAHTSNFIFIPNEWFNADDLSVYSQYLASSGKIYSKPTKLGFNTIFCIDDFIAEQLPNEANIFTQASSLIAVIDALPNHALLIDFTSSSFNVLYTKDGKLNFQNHFSAETGEEFNYFLLFIIKALDLNDSIPVYIQGIIDEDDAHYNCLLKYFNQLYFFTPQKNSDNELLADMPKHYFSDLLAIGLCE
ncbi:DUF3822 family protein [Pedobacter changchengzhani]|uniref:DUF3822 family protein n=1 Tax=Pedobacter changchengzhani TaxID=2529274 RepID=A0A4R5MMX4_9SPHI|nr:DUF3822 family protein [Pedobacter changchengzhani]TDG36876.1 DUF3822 family protein [Pedobacter changchengzhani]